MRPLPCDPDGTTEAVVYYQLREIWGEELPDDTVSRQRSDDIVLDLTRVTSVTLRYFFYYPADFGVNGHCHDMEGMDLTIVISSPERPGTGLYEARLLTVVGWAHGSTWYANVLHLDGQTVSLPITILVEEGKHASCPDRNGDGNYTPAYDVNRRTNDAWGVRDTFGSGSFRRAAYDPSQFKPRQPKDRYWLEPEAVDESCLEGAYHGPEKAGSDKTYRLRYVFSDELGDCSSAQLQKWFKEKGFGAERFPETKAGAPKGVRAALLDLIGFEPGDSQDLLTDRILASFAYRNDHGHGVAVAGPGILLPWFGSWLVPRATYTFSDPWDQLGFEGLYTPSASQAFDFYGSMGAVRRIYSDQSIPSDWRMTTEAGLRFRFKPFGSLIGARIGVRVFGFRRPEDPQVVFELGGGVF